MLYDLIRVLPVALLVCLLPGWFWARLLSASADRAEQATYAIALAITLVPTAGLVLSRLLGTGVTLTIAVAAPLLVFATGLVAYLYLGPAKGPDAPLAPLPALPGTAALAVLAAALALAFVAFFDLVAGAWPAILVVPVVLLAGVIHLWAYPDPSPANERTAAISPWIRYGVLSAALVLVLLRGYLGPMLHRWPYPRGVDRYEHAVMTGMTLSEGSTQSFMLYPPGFHFLAAELSRLTSLEPLALFPILAPLLLLLPAIACYALARRLWGWECGVAAALLSGLILGGPYLHFAEARYPNFIGTQFLVIVAVAVLVSLYASPPSARGGLLLATLGSSTVLYHQIAGYTLAVVLAFVGLLFVPYLLLRDRPRGVALFLSLALLGIFSVFYAWDTYDLGRLAAGLLGEKEETGRGGEAVAMAIGTKPTYDIGHLLATTTEPVAWLGLLGVLLVSGELLRRRVGAPQALAYLTVLLWALLLFAGSRTSYSGFPDRFERDFGIPLAVFAALALVALSRSVWRRRGAALAAASVAVLLAAVLVGAQVVRNLEQAAGPSPRLKDRPPPPAVASAGKWLETNNDGGNIVATPYLNYVPSRGMLAMGGYTGMQSYDAARIRRGRDLPPFGAGPLWDALWVLKNPEGEKTSRIITENDVRYVVFHKRYPGANWRNFERREDLYSVAFENEGVVIYEPR
ncbi:MAG TPA: hypothetical protein VHH10_12030 [Rubrobacteraceae bacterium]|nr:hypothetical protein [Rubrobacteraceae bacterium]